jgi:CSLREA domain-containing protein
LGRHRAYVVALALVCSFAPAAAARAATINVTTELDASVASDGQCSLREAVVAAALDQPSGGTAGECAAGSPGPDTVAVPAGLYGLNSLLGVFGDVTIAGAGAASTVISQGGADRVITMFPFTTGDPTDLTLDGVTVTGGHPADGGNGADGFGSNGAPGGFPGLPGSGGGGQAGQNGGAIFNDDTGTLTLLNTRITGNSAGNGGGGGMGFGGDGGDGVGAGTCGLAGEGTGGTGGPGGDGGAIFSFGPVTVRDSTISANSAGTGGPGGRGIGGSGGRSGAQFLQGCTGGHGKGGGGGAGGDGGAILASAPVTVERSVITGNRTGAGGAAARGDGGAGGLGGAMGGTGGQGGKTTGGAGGAGGEGGAVRAVGGTATVTIIASTISGNTTGAGGTGGGGLGGPGGDGGGTTGIGWFGGDATGGTGGAGGDGAGISAAAALNASGSLFLDNHAGAGGAGGSVEGGIGGSGGISNGHGGAGGTGTGGTGGAGGRGGAAITAGTSQVVNSTIAQNGGGGGALGGGGLGGHGGNAPASGAGSGGSGAGGVGGSAGGGGLTVLAGGLDVVNATIGANAAGAPGGGGTGTGGLPGSGSSPGFTGGATNGAAGASAPGGLHNTAGSLSLANSIVSSNTPTNCAGAITDGGHNIRFGDETCPGSTADPLLSPVADNGGPTRTQALGAGSAALDAVPASGAGCTSTDQRGVSRPRGPACDAGAYEKAAPDVTTGDASAVSLTSATVNGLVTPNAGSATYHFEYGTTAAYGSSTATENLGGGVTPAGVAAALSGLATNTTYHYRLVATTGDGSAAGADRTFTTARDSTPPRFLSASIRPRIFAVNRRGAREKPVTAVKRGTTFRFGLSEDARVLFTIARQRPGRRVGGRCVKPTPRNRSKRPCKRYVKVGRFAMNAKAGANRKRFSGRIGRKTLSPGPYRATLVARDAALNASAPRRLSFRVVRALTR